MSRFCSLAVAYGLARAWAVSGRGGCQGWDGGLVDPVEIFRRWRDGLRDRKLTCRVLRWPGDHVVVACVLRAAQARSPNMATADDDSAGEDWDRGQVHRLVDVPRQPRRGAAAPAHRATGRCRARTAPAAGPPRCRRAARRGRP